MTGLPNRKRISSQSEISSSSEEAENEADLDGPGKMMWMVNDADVRDAPTLEDIQSAFALNLLCHDLEGHCTLSDEDLSTPVTGKGKANSSEIDDRRASIFLLDSPEGHTNDAHDDSRSASSVCNLYEQSFEIGLPSEFETNDEEEDIGKLLENVDIPPHVVAGIWRKVRRDECEIQYLRSVISSYEEICMSSMTAQDREGLMSQLSMSPACTLSSPVTALHGRQQVIASCIHGPLNPEEKTKCFTKAKTTGHGSGL
eukprot:gnl/MRDRNA2_/MRDRNA2_105214_c0_seq1.p1 gnl/MRDRNA2_/MRDRNA2_105214_c0~~gnl/MRDRNA2_/MRDRNA2_105214_c0_seq1.p1  ORF type:complete len:257 (-),score=41.86 gnl/MRDRNA2_/MRDRNA2_105214_c0_seq1:60-830(-)